MKKILITGATSGIGRQIAIDLSKEGYCLIIIGRDENKINNVMDCLHNPDYHQVINWDLSNFDEYDAKLESVSALDGLVHSAGMWGNSLPVSFTKLSDIQEVFNTNVFSIIHIISKLSRGKKINRNASIILLSSIAANYGVVGTLAYAMSKGALNSAVRVLASEFSGKGIRVNAIAPGMVHTPMLEKIKSKLTKEQIEKDVNDYLLGYGETTDVSNLVRFLLSYEQSKWVTGSILNIDGGYKLR